MNPDIATSERGGAGTLLDRLCHAVYAAISDVRVGWTHSSTLGISWDEWRDKHLGPWLVRELEASGLNPGARDEDARRIIIAGKMIKQFERQIRADLEEIKGEKYILALSAYYRGKLDRIRYDLAEIEKIREAIGAD